MPCVHPSVSWFVGEDGYTSVAMALALLVSLTLVFGAATACWEMSRADEVQAVADATALAGANVVAAFSTVAQVTDACVLSLGIVGVVVLGAGLVLSCVPVAAAAAPAVVDAGRQILDARRSFAESAAEGLQGLEQALPAAIVANSASCAAAGSSGGVSYVGCALPFPLGSRSDYGSLDADVATQEMEEQADEMAELTQKAQESREEASRLLEEGWRADCGTTPRCLRERAQALAGLSGVANPSYALAQWNFGVPLSRARAYYAMRYQTETPLGGDVESLVDSAVRKAFYRYALDETLRGHYYELPDGSCDVSLPKLPHNAAEARGTSLYTSASWPCTQEAGGRVLHGTSACPAARGPASGTASLRDLEAGRVSECGTCRMGMDDLGRVAAASTNIDNGFEYWWKRVVDASEPYERARNEAAAAEQEAREVAEESADAFSEALEALGVARVSLCPPGAWGCVAVVARPEAVAAPSALTRAFLSGTRLPAGAAVSAAVLAPEDGTAPGNVLSHLTDGLEDTGSLPAWLAGQVCDLWGSLLEGYGGAYGSVADAAGTLFDGLDVVGGLGTWLKGKLKSLVEAAGLEPRDLRLRKPVLTSTQNVLAKAGYDTSLLERCVRTMSDTGSPEQAARMVGVELVGRLTGGTVTIADLSIPGTGLSIPLTVDLTGWGEAA